MNVSKDKRHPCYICDKCGNTIYYEYRKGFNVNKYYKQRKADYVLKKDFDLCESCEIKFREWLNTKEIQTTKEFVKGFPVYKEED